MKDGVIAHSVVMVIASQHITGHVLEVVMLSTRQWN